jgi:multiple RNA-binding domain-containing protein 1
MRISKSEILNPESSDNAAVKLALAETHIIQETKTYLESQGVLLDSFSSRARSDTIILVKNIPYGTSAAQITELFEPHGALVRVLVPPAGTMAVVEFARADEAGAAFRAVAYRRLGNSVVYLEKGPLGMFGEGPVGQTTGAASNAHVVKIAEQAVGEEEGEEPALGAGTTLFVKNLSFATSAERMTQMFGGLPSFSFARVQTKPDPKRPDARLSMGYGFVGFKDVEGAKKALKSMQGFVLDGHALHVNFAGRGAEETEKGKGGATASAKSRTTKMIVKNVPFEATKKDIRELFGYAHRLIRFIARRSYRILFLAHTATSSPCACRRSSTRGRAGSPSSTLCRDTRPRMRTLRCGTRICLGGIWFWSGRRKRSRIWMRCARRLGLDSGEGGRCPGGSGNWTWERTGKKILRGWSRYKLMCYVCLLYEDSWATGLGVH